MTEATSPRGRPAGASAHGAVDWAAAEAEIEDRGYAAFPLLPPGDCAALAALYTDERLFRRRVVMERHGYGQGEYQYFAAPLPEPVARLREALYPPLAAIADRWAGAAGRETRFPPDLAGFLARCHAAGQTKPTPLLLAYGPGGFNRLHQDLYGEHVFPLQVTVLLSAPGRDFTGGEFVLAEQRARMQARVEVVPLGQGDAVVFPVRERPVPGVRGPALAAVRHGVSRLHAGRRLTLGIIFHDAA